ncbi:single-stranded-DNA-specific exonuclease RecJ [Candidatus Pelagibacter bacterium nBUS_32]|uniref:single-stranded-DNA-specific exonuclease RecJ n=1 Tax=Candidatus Pelagibacter bacterium nBUS_32 TaxID=3374192 RepID=UPI003EB89937
MISISGKKWVERKVNKNLIEKIKQDFNFKDILARLIVLRNYDITEINNINNSLKLTNIFKNNSDFISASNILLNSINEKENICILGDYDVDGISATSLLIRYFKHIKQNFFYYIPEREKDGYGATTKLFQKLISKKPKLVIMVDCGSTSNKAIDYLNQNNIKSIIIDHHEMNKPYPKSSVIINPKKNTDYSEYDYLCSTTLTYFFIDMVILKMKSKFRLSDFLIYVLLATVCDVMPLRKLNKILSSNVLKNFKMENNLAFKTIFNELSLKKKLTVEDLGFLIGPIINSGGRLGYSNYGVELLTSNNKDTLQKKTLELINLNNKRKKLEKNILNEINFTKISKKNKNIIIYHDNNMHEGLIGIIAARLKEYFNKPSIVLTKSNNLLKASARSTKNYNIGKIIKVLIDKNIIEKGGGHNMAAGFSIKKNNLRLLDDFIQKDYLRNNQNFKLLFKYDSEISASALNKDFYDEIDKLGPFGNDNELPIFLIKNVKIFKPKVVGENHISSIIKPSSGRSIKSICFNCANTKISEYLLSYKKKINIIAHIAENSFNNKKSIQLNIKDLFLSGN